MNTASLLATWFAGALLLGGCASVDVAPLEKFDERSGDTLIVVRQPLEFVRVRQVLEGTRDYLRLVAVEEDHLGQYNTWLLAYRWSTSEKGPAVVPDERRGTLQLRGDGMEWTLQPLAEVPESLRARADLHAPAPAPFAAWAYRVTLADLREVAASRSLTAQLPGEEVADELQLLGDGRPALLHFAQRGAVN